MQLVKVLLQDLNPLHRQIAERPVAVLPVLPGLPLELQGGCQPEQVAGVPVQRHLFAGVVVKHLSLVPRLHHSLRLCHPAPGLLPVCPVLYQLQNLHYPLAVFGQFLLVLFLGLLFRAWFQHILIQILISSNNAVSCHSTPKAGTLRSRSIAPPCLSYRRNPQAIRVFQAELQSSLETKLVPAQQSPCW